MGKNAHFMTLGFLNGAGAETLILVAGTSGKWPNIFVSQQKNQSQLCTPRKPRKIGVWVSGAEIQTSAVESRTAVWVSTAEKIFKIVLGETQNYSRKLRGSQHQICIKPRPLFKNRDARVETRVLKTLACRKNVGGFFKHWYTACRCVLETRVSKKWV